MLMTVNAETKQEKGEDYEDEAQLGQAWDDLTGAELDPREVKKAREREVGYVRNKKVWVKIARREAQRRGIKVLTSRWIFINKGDRENPDVRSRFVAKEFNTGEEVGLFAATPPLEALKVMLSFATTEEIGFPVGRSKEGLTF